MNRSRVPCLVFLLLVGMSLMAEARVLPDKPYRTYLRRRISPTDPDLEIIEVKKVYFERRPKKVIVRMDEDEMDWRILCDFEPQRKECKYYLRKGIGCLSGAPSTTTTTSTSTTTTTTTTELPKLPVLEEETDAESQEEETTPVYDDSYVALDEDDGEGYEDEADGRADYEEEKDDYMNAFGSGGSIGYNDQSALE
ncbi:hypothetical protein KR018_002070, partial [Drosophila ironensis]